MRGDVFHKETDCSSVSRDLHCLLHSHKLCSLITSLSVCFFLPWHLSSCETSYHDPHYCLLLLLSCMHWINFNPACLRGCRPFLGFSCVGTPSSHEAPYLAHWRNCSSYLSLPMRFWEHKENEGEELAGWIWTQRQLTPMSVWFPLPQTKHKSLRYHYPRMCSMQGDRSGYYYFFLAILILPLCQVSETWQIAVFCYL